MRHHVTIEFNSTLEGYGRLNLIELSHDDSHSHPKETEKVCHHDKAITSYQAHPDHICSCHPRKGLVCQEDEKGHEARSALFVVGSIV